MLSSSHPQAEAINILISVLKTTSLCNINDYPPLTLDTLNNYLVSSYIWTYSTLHHWVGRYSLSYQNGSGTSWESCCWSCENTRKLESVDEYWWTSYHCPRSKDIPTPSPPSFLFLTFRTSVEKLLETLGRNKLGLTVVHHLMLYLFFEVDTLTGKITF